MTVRYSVRKVGLVPKYVCQREAIEHAERICQSVSGLGIDEAVGGLLLEILTPWTLEVALAVQQELQQRLDEADHLRRQHVERARYDADLARDRFMQVDPKNRLVADSLEANWNERLRALAEAQEQYERQRQADRAVLDEESRHRILALTTDFPKLWKDPNTPDRDRKRMARLLIEDVTLTKGEQLTIQVRFKGGTVRTLISPMPQPSWMIWQTNREVVAEVDRLLDDHTDSRIAAILNERGWHPGKGGLFTKGIIACIRTHYRLRSRFDRLREAGMLTQQEIADQLGVSRSTVEDWRRSGLLKAHVYNDKPGYVYEPPGTNAPRKKQGVKRTHLHRFPTASTEKTKEVQDEA
jgi:Homeodomain-like domain